MWIILIGILVLPLYGIYEQIILGKPFGNNPMSDIGLIFLTIFVFALVILFAIVKLETTITSESIKMRLFPFVSKKVNWEDVTKIAIVNYGFIGGWGIRPWTKFGTVYNIRGNQGLALELKDGTKFVIGTQRTKELQEAINSLRKG